MREDSPNGARAKVPEEAISEETPRGLWARVRDALSAPGFAERQEMPGSWARRITDEANLWLTAVSSQLQGDFAEAATRYLEDSKRELLQGQRARAALSLAMAGFVLKEAGEEPLAIQCYQGAARQFRAHADESVATSPRDALWALERAGVFFALGRRPEAIDEVRAKYKVLNAALHPDQADRVPEVFLQPEAPMRPATAGGGVPRARGVRVLRDYVARLERLLDGL